MAEIGAELLEQERRRTLQESITQLADAVLEATTEHDSIKEQLSQKSNEITTLKAELIRELASVGLTKATLDNGVSVAVENYSEYRVLKEDRSKQFAWLRATDAGGMIQTVDSVHYKTFESHCKALAAGGEEIPPFVKFSEWQKVQVKKGGE